MPHQKEGDKKKKKKSQDLLSHNPPAYLPMLGFTIWELELDQKHPLGYSNKLKDNVTTYSSASPKRQNVFNAV